MIDVTTLWQLILPAAFLGYAYAYGKYWSKILDPSKVTPEKFEWSMALSTTLVAIIISVVFKIAGTELNMTGLDIYMGMASGIITGYVNPMIMAVYRKFFLDMSSS